MKNEEIINNPLSEYDVLEFLAYVYVENI